jgi:hypothetical protein
MAMVALEMDLSKSSARNHNTPITQNVKKLTSAEAEMMVSVCHRFRLQLLKVNVKKKVATSGIQTHQMMISLKSFAK